MTVLTHSGAFAEVQPPLLGRLLKSSGWSRGDEDRRWVLWTKQVDDEQAEIQVPQLREARDYPNRVFEALTNFALIEGIEVDAALEGVTDGGNDTIKARIPDAVHGSIQIDDAAASLSGFRDLLLAAAASVVDPRPVYKTVKPTAAVDYLAEVELAAPKSGSFVFEARSPVPSTVAPQEVLHEALAEPPFARRVVERVYLASAQAAKAARAVVESDETDAFANAVGDGVSANLCEALHKLASASPSDSLELGVRFATVRASTLFPGDLLTPIVRFDGLLIEQVAEAARVLRKDEPDYGVTIEGAVVRLHRRVDEGPGEVTVSAYHQGRMRQIRLSFQAADYVRLVDAHRDGSMVTVECDVHRRGPRFMGSRPRIVQIGPGVDD